MWSFTEGAQYSNPSNFCSRYYLRLLEAMIDNLRVIEEFEIPFDKDSLVHTLQAVRDLGYQPQNFVLCPHVYRSLISLFGVEVVEEKVAPGLKGKVFGVRMLVLEEEQVGRLVVVAKREDNRSFAFLVYFESKQS